MADKLKCTVRDGKFVEPCDALREVTEYSHPRKKQKGIFAYRYSTPERGPTRTMFGAQSGDRVQSGLLFNFCPYCGEKIDQPFSESAA